MANIGNKDLAIIPAAQLQYRNADTEYRFRQSSDFLYVCALNEPDACLVLANGESWLFCHPDDPDKARWDGPRLGPTQAQDTHQLDHAFPLADMPKQLQALLANAEQVWAPKQLPDILSQCLTDANITPSDISAQIAELRLIKSDSEIETLRRAIAISSAGHINCMQHCQAGLKETQLLGHFMHPMLAAGELEFAYPPIIASGANACILHYVELKDTLRDGDLVLLDIGVEVDGYAADITRTYPVNGRFSSAQAALYQAVLEIQLALIDAIKPGENWQNIQAYAIRLTTQALQQLGILHGETEQLIKDKAYQHYFMHGFGHWLGLDVHDAGNRKLANGQPRPFEPGMVMTVEPGIYIAPNAKVDPQWQGMAVRIEDNILVTAQGCTVLSAAIPKHIAELEAAIGHE